MKLFNNAIGRNKPPAPVHDPQIVKRNNEFITRLTANLTAWNDEAMQAGVQPRVRETVLAQPLALARALTDRPDLPVAIPAGLPRSAMQIIFNTADNGNVRVLGPKSVSGPAAAFSPEHPPGAMQRWNDQIAGLRFPVEWQREGVEPAKAVAENAIAGRWRDLAEDICAAPDVRDEDKIVLLTALRTRLEDTIRATSLENKTNFVGFHVYKEFTDLLCGESANVQVPTAVHDAFRSILGEHGVALRVGVTLQEAGVRSQCTPEDYEFDFDKVPAARDAAVAGVRIQPGERPLQRPAPESKTPPAADQARPAEPLAAVRPLRTSEDIDDGLKALPTLRVSEILPNVLSLFNAIDGLSQATPGLKESLQAQLATAARDAFEATRAVPMSREGQVAWSAARLTVFERLDVKLDQLARTAPIGKELQGVAYSIKKFVRTVNDEPMGGLSINTVDSPERLVWTAAPFDAAEVQG